PGYKHCWTTLASSRSRIACEREIVRRRRRNACMFRIRFTNFLYREPTPRILDLGWFGKWLELRCRRASRPADIARCLLFAISEQSKLNHLTDGVVQSGVAPNGVRIVPKIPGGVHNFTDKCLAVKFKESDWIRFPTVQVVLPDDKQL